jgi:hypothetical protein
MELAAKLYLVFLYVNSLTHTKKKKKLWNRGRAVGDEFKQGLPNGEFKVGT